MRYPWLQVGIYPVNPLTNSFFFFNLLTFVESTPHSVGIVWPI